MHFIDHPGLRFLGEPVPGDNHQSITWRMIETPPKPTLLILTLQRTEIWNSLTPFQPPR